MLILLMQRARVGMQDWGVKVIKNAFSESELNGGGVGQEGEKSN